MAGVLNVVTPVPPATTDPPVGEEYQSAVVPAGVETTSCTEPAPTVEPWLTSVGAAGDWFAGHNAV